MEGKKQMGRKPTKGLDKVEKAIIYMRHTRALVWKSDKINGLIDSVEDGSLVSIDALHERFIEPEPVKPAAKTKPDMSALLNIPGVTTANNVVEGQVIIEKDGPMGRTPMTVKPVYIQLDPQLQKLENKFHKLLAMRPNESGQKVISAQLDQWIEDSER